MAQYSAPLLGQSRAARELGTWRGASTTAEGRPHLCWILGAFPVTASSSSPAGSKAEDAQRMLGGGHCNPSERVAGTPAACCLVWLLLGFQVHSAL